MFVAKQTLDTIFILKVDVPQDVISLNKLIEDVEVKRQLVNALNLLYELTADWASNSEVVVQN